MRIEVTRGSVLSDVGLQVIDTTKQKNNQLGRSAITHIRQFYESTE